MEKSFMEKFIFCAVWKKMRRVREISMICLTKIIDDSVIVVLICQASHNLKILMFPPSIEI